MEDTIRSSSMVMPFSGVTSDPVASSTFLVESRLSLPSAAVTRTCPGVAVSAPAPLTYVTLFFLKRPSMPLVSPVTAASLCSIIFATSTRTLSTSTPCFAKSFFA